MTDPAPLLPALPDIFDGFRLEIGIRAIMHLTEHGSSIIFYHKEIADVPPDRTFPPLLPR